MSASWACVLAWALLLHQPAKQGTPAICACAAARETGGWCDVHGVGYLGGVKIASQSLFEVMDAHGHDVDPATFPCPTCKQALVSDGYCAEHRVGFVRGKAYFSLLTHHLAKGEVRHPHEITCRRCRRNARTHGWCEADGVGMIGSIALADRREFEQAVRAAAVLQAADETARRCETCAAAMVTDTSCPFCRIHYQDGKAVARR